MVKKLFAFRLSSEAVSVLEWAKLKGDIQVQVVEKALALYYAVEKSKETTTIQKSANAIQKEFNGLVVE